MSSMKARTMKKKPCLEKLNKTKNKNVFIYLVVCVYVCVCAHVYTCMLCPHISGHIEDNMRALALSFHHMGHLCHQT